MTHETNEDRRRWLKTARDDLRAWHMKLCCALYDPLGQWNRPETMLRQLPADDTALRDIQSRLLAWYSILTTARHAIHQQLEYFEHLVRQRTRDDHDDHP